MPEGKYTERGFFVGAESFEQLYEIIEEKGGLETSNGPQSAKHAKKLLRLFELTGQGANSLSRHDGLREAAISLRQKEIGELQKEIYDLKS